MSLVPTEGAELPQPPVIESAPTPVAPPPLTDSVAVAQAESIIAEASAQFPSSEAPASDLSAPTAPESTSTETQSLPNIETPPAGDSIASAPEIADISPTLPEQNSTSVESSETEASIVSDAQPATPSPIESTSVTDGQNTFESNIEPTIPEPTDEVATTEMNSEELTAEDAATMGALETLATKPPSENVLIALLKKAKSLKGLGRKTALAAAGAGLAVMAASPEPGLQSDMTDNERVAIGEQMRSDLTKGLEETAFGNSNVDMEAAQASFNEVAAGINGTEPARDPAFPWGSTVDAEGKTVAAPAPPGLGDKQFDPSYKPVDLTSPDTSVPPAPPGFSDKQFVPDASPFGTRMNEKGEVITNPAPPGYSDKQPETAPWGTTTNANGETVAAPAPPGYGDLQQVVPSPDSSGSTQPVSESPATNNASATPVTTS